MNETIRPSAQYVRSVYRALFFDIARLTSSNLSSDWAYFQLRLEKEGLPFALNALPLLGKAFENAIITNRALQCPKGIRLKKGTRLPLFLFTLFSRVFSKDGLCLLDPEMDHGEAMLQTVRGIRQLLLAFSKAETELPEDMVDKACNAFLERVCAKGSMPQDSLLLSRARELLGRVFSGNSPTLRRLQEFQKNPWGRHGPGAVAGQECGSEKWHADMWPGLPENLFSWQQAACFVPRRRLQEQPAARLRAVPKDFRGPRIICIEPKENQFAQQGLMELLYAHLQSHPLTRRSMNFESVDESRRLCYGDYSTIDLKDASDHIPLSLVRLLLPSWLFALLTRYRTRTLAYKGKLYKSLCFASMGNAVCFPVETMVFWALARSAMSLVVEDWKPYRYQYFDQTLRVFGDDVIVPTWACDAVLEAFESCHMVVNYEKTCHMTLIKESCGEWVFNGRSCGIVKFRSTDVKDLRSWIQARDYSHQLIRFGYLMTAESVREAMFLVFPQQSFRTRWNRRLQIMEVRVPLPFTKGRKLKLSGYRALYAWWVGNDVTPFLRGARQLAKWGWIDQSLFDV